MSKKEVCRAAMRAERGAWCSTRGSRGEGGGGSGMARFTRAFAASFGVFFSVRFSRARLMAYAC